jgi:RNA methyltransferase, TrmH family
MRISKAELKYIRSLSQKKVRQAERKFVLEGWRALKEVLNSPSKVEVVAVLSRFLEDPDYEGILSKLRERNVPVKELAETELNQVADTIHAQGVLAVVQQKTHEISEEHLRKATLIVAADGVSDPGNLGSIVRSSDWFAADMVLLGQGCVELYNDKVVRSTVGSILHVPVVEGVDLPSALPPIKERGFSVVAYSGEGKQSYIEHRPAERQVVVFGNEAHGVSREVRSIADSVVRIPKYGKAESLNVGVACGIVLAHLREQREKKKGD